MYLYKTWEFFLENLETTYENNNGPTPVIYKKSIFT